MSKAELGRLVPVDLREVWNNEATEFTPWLALEDNLALLGKTIGLELELESVEKGVGPYRADILCKDTLTNNWVLVENQLEQTDHSHLGQLLTYAAGLNTVTIVWIARRFTEEHRATLDWLNDATGDEINLFGLEVELWQIGDSPPAPKFNMVSKPNTWTKHLTARRQHLEFDDLTETQQIQLDYWTGFRDYLTSQETFLKGANPYPRNNMGFAIGRSFFYLLALTNSRENWIGVKLDLTGSDAKSHYHLLHLERVEIESDLGSRLDWQESPKGKESQILLRKLDMKPLDQDHWADQWYWLHEKLEGFHRVFAPRIKLLDATDYVEEKDEEPIEQ